MHIGTVLYGTYEYRTLQAPHLQFSTSTSTDQYDPMQYPGTSTCTRTARHRARGMEPLPARPEAVRAYIFHCTADRGLDAQTVEGRMSALGDWHGRQSSALVRVGRPALGNPGRTAPVTELLAVVQDRPPGAASSHTVRVQGDVRLWPGPVRSIWSSPSSLPVISTLGCLRRKAAVSLRVSYTISGSIISFSSSSGVYIAYDRATQMEWPACQRG